MLANRFTVVLDTNVLYGALVANIALSLGAAQLFRPRWSGQTLDELVRTLSKRIGNDKAQAKRDSIEDAFPEGIVEVPLDLLEPLNLPDQDDRHILGAAIKARAALIVSENLKDFPSEELDKYEVEVVTPDAFFADTLDLATAPALEAISQMRSRIGWGSDQLILRCEKIGLSFTADKLNEFKSML